MRGGKKDTSANIAARNIQDGESGFTGTLPKSIQIKR